MSRVSERDQQESTVRPSHFTDFSWAQMVFGDTPSRVASLLVGLLLSGCATTLPPAKSTFTFDQGCISTAPVSIKNVPLHDAEPSVPDPVAAEPGEAGQIYSPTALDIADTMHMLPLLQKLARLEIHHNDTIVTDRVRRKLLARLQLATMEVASLVAELECEVHRIDEVQDRLKYLQDTRSTSQTILSVVIGGLVNVMTGGLGIATGAGNTAQIISIAGGTMEVLFGTSANFTKVRQEFRHPHNHLEKIWTGEEDHHYYSVGVWRFLTKPNRRDMHGESLRTVLLQAWEQDGRLGTPGSRREQERISLLLGSGGVYDADDLHIREAMLQQLESVIQLMHQDLETLLREVLLHQAAEEDAL